MRDDKYRPWDWTDDALPSSVSLLNEPILQDAVELRAGARLGH
jgi:hypothetical protein